jgi:hypothetical protein
MDEEEVRGLRITQRIDGKCDMCEQPLFATAVIVNSRGITVSQGKVVKKPGTADSNLTICDACFSSHIYENTRFYK